MRPLLAVAAVAALTLTAPAAVAKPKPASCSTTLADAAHDHLPGGPLGQASALDIRWARVTIARGEVVVLLAVGAPWAEGRLPGDRAHVAFQANGVDYAFTVARAAGGADTATATVGAEPVGAMRFRTAGLALEWRVPRPSALAKPHTAVSVLRAMTTTLGLTADSATASAPQRCAPGR